MFLAQILTGLALFIGEALIIGAEMWAAKNFEHSNRPEYLILTAFVISVIGAGLLVYGYVWGYQAFKNIWIVTALSVAGILIVEPLIAWFLFQEIPTKGALIGFILGVLGLISTLTIR